MMKQVDDHCFHVVKGLAQKSIKVKIITVHLIDYKTLSILFEQRTFIKKTVNSIIEEELEVRKSIESTLF